MVTKKKTTTVKKETKKKTTARKPAVKKKKTVEMPTPEEINEAIKNITMQKRAENNLEQPKYEDATVQDAVDIGVKIDDAIKELLKEPSYEGDYGEWQPVMNVLTRMYEASEDDYQNVKFHGNNTISVNLDRKIYSDVNKEIDKIKNQLSMDTLTYQGIDDKQNNRIAIIIKQK